MILLPLLGAVAGAWLLLLTPSRVFAWLVPYLIISATVLFAIPERGLDAAAARPPVGLWAFLLLFGGSALAPSASTAATSGRASASWSWPRWG